MSETDNEAVVSPEVAAEVAAAPDTAQATQEVLFEDPPALVVPDELTSLKSRADLLGVRYHPTIGLAKLKLKIETALAAEKATVAPVATTASGAGTALDEVQASIGFPAQVPARPKTESEQQFRHRKRREANALVRIRVNCMNPAKSEWEGEIFTAGNGVVGSMTKFVPFNTEDGWHVPMMILKQMEQRKCQIFVQARDSRGNISRKGKMIKEFTIERLAPLTRNELQELAQRQAMAKSID